MGWLVRETDSGITAQRIGGEAPSSPHRGLLIAAHLVWLAALAGGALGLVAGRVGRVLSRRTWRHRPRPG